MTRPDVHDHGHAIPAYYDHRRGGRTGWWRNLPPGCDVPKVTDVFGMLLCFGQAGGYFQAVVLVLDILALLCRRTFCCPIRAGRDGGRRPPYGRSGTRCHTAQLCSNAVPPSRLCKLLPLPIQLPQAVPQAYNRQPEKTVGAICRYTVQPVNYPRQRLTHHRLA